MTRLFYQLDDQIYFDSKAFYAWVDSLGINDAQRIDDIEIEWIDKSGLIQIS